MTGTAAHAGGTDLAIPDLWTHGQFDTLGGIKPGWLLFWGSLWGPWGLILALPITAMMKIVFDHVERLRPFGDWLGE